jgi:hypothetical protein
VVLDLLVRRSQVPKSLLQRLDGGEWNPRSEHRLAVDMQSIRDRGARLAGRTARAEADNDLCRLGDLLDRHLAEIAERIIRLADPTDSAAILQGEVIRTHPAVAGPTHEAVHDPVLSPLFQHARRLYKARLWMVNKGRIWRDLRCLS